MHLTVDRFVPRLVLVDIKSLVEFTGETSHLFFNVSPPFTSWMHPSFDVELGSVGLIEIETGYYLNVVCRQRDQVVV